MYGILWNSPAFLCRISTENNSLGPRPPARAPFAPSAQLLQCLYGLYARYRMHLCGLWNAHIHGPRPHTGPRMADARLGIPMHGSEYRCTARSTDARLGIPMHGSEYRCTARSTDARLGIPMHGSECRCGGPECRCGGPECRCGGACFLQGDMIRYSRLKRERGMVTWRIHIQPDCGADAFARTRMP